MYDYMSVNNKMLFNQMLLRISMLSENMKKNDPEKFATAVAGLGRLGKDEVVTPPMIVKKMIGKLNKSVYTSAKSILLVNEKHGEFFEELCNQFGTESMAKKCKIAPSSMVGYHLIRAKLKHLGLGKYINDIILSIEDIDGNSKYDIKDFLSMSNSDIMKKNGGKKFDVVLMNPPYDKTLHIKFLEKVSNISNNIISVQPLDWIFKEKHEDIKHKIHDVELIPGDEFRKIFNIQSNKGGIIILNDNGGFDINSLQQEFPYKKIIENTRITFKDVNVLNYDENGIFVPLKLMTAEWDKNKDFIVDKLGILVDGKTTDGIYYKDKRNRNKNRPCGGIYFDTLEEAQNFVNYTKTDFFVKLVNFTHVSSRYLLKHYPFLNYKEKWTDEKLYKVFNLTGEEIQQIKNYALK